MAPARPHRRSRRRTIPRPLLLLLLAACALAVPLASAAVEEERHDAGEELLRAPGRRLLAGTAASASASTAPGPPAGMTLPTGRPFNIGALTGMQDIWVNPVAGKDSNSGATRAAALRTLAAAWQRIPQWRVLARGYRIRITPGRVAQNQMPNYWEGRWGSRAAPIIIEAADGRGTVTMGNINAKELRHFYLINLILRSPNDLFHCELCTHTLLRNITAIGQCTAWAECSVREAIKMNQCQGVWVENVDVSYANDNAFDCVSCQYGHIINSRFRHSDWGVYLKGGSAYFIVSGNEISNGGSTGFAAGQGTGFEWMSRPWLQYEAYDVKFFNNVVRDIDGAGFGAWGCYNCLFAYNTLVRVGRRSHAIEVKFGSRSCDDLVANCSAHAAAGGWGATARGDSAVVNIPNRNVMIANNIVYNPPGYQTEWQHLQVDNPMPSNSPRLPRTVYADTNLTIRGNLVWNGGKDKPLGVDGGCPPTNPTCNPGQLLSQNWFNTGPAPSISLTTLRPAASLLSFPLLWQPLPSFGPWDPTTPPGPAVPAGTLSNAIAGAADKAGAARSPARNAPGALLP